MTTTTSTANPVLQPWPLPGGLPQFSAAEAHHFAPAFEAAMQAHRAEVETIASNPQPASFDNTLVAFDASGRLLAQVSLWFDNLCSSHTSPALQDVQRELAAPQAQHRSAIYQHEGLFARIQAVHSRKEQLGLSPEQTRLVERVHQDFVRAGAQLPPAQRLRAAQITAQLAELTTQFGQNVLFDESSFALALPSPSEQAGLPDGVLAAAQGAAAERGLPHPVITLSRSLILPFLTFSTRRDLREQVWRAWTSRGEHAGTHDNRPLIRQILTLRAELAALHGQACYADHALQATMARTLGAVQQLLDDVWPRALTAAAREQAQIEAAMAADGVSTRLEAWDWRYWAEKVRQRDYAVDDAKIKPYMPLDAMVQAAFECATRLFGVRITHRPDQVAYHPDVKVYDVHNADGTLRGVFLHDNFARPSKRSGAWMSLLREQTRNGAPLLPIVLNNNNFAKAAPGEPTLLSFEDVETLFHEFGHGLHGLLSDVTYGRLSGVNVLGDFVELPSQLYEHWLSEPEVLQRHARHVVTGEPMPLDLIQRIQRARRFGQGYETVRYVASCLTDLAVHALPGDQVPTDPVAFEAQVLADRGLPHATGLNHRFTHFQHLFSGDYYASGYYYYLWAEVLDADAFKAFEEAGSAFDPGVAARLLQHIYAAGDSVEPGAAYRAFRGRAPRVEAMLEQRGLLQPA